MGILQELDNDYKIAEDWLLNYELKKEQYYRDLNYIRDENPMHEVYVRTGPGNIVMQKVVTLAELDRAEKWLLTIELVQNKLGPKKRAFLEVRREARRMNHTVNGREVWRGYVQTHYADRMAKEYATSMDKYWLSERAIMYWWKTLVETTRLIALKRGCSFGKK